MAYDVAPFMGAWIEIDQGKVEESARQVAPFMGAWIEIHPSSPGLILIKSHPLWVRGLKFKIRYTNARNGRRRTLYGCVD